LFLLFRYYILDYFVLSFFFASLAGFLNIKSIKVALSLKWLDPFCFVNCIPCSRQLNKYFDEAVLVDDVADDDNDDDFATRYR